MKIYVFTTSVCPHCPPAKELVKKVCEEKGIDYEIVVLDQPEGEKYMELANSLGIMAVPTIVLENDDGSYEIVSVGVPPEDAFVKYVDEKLN